MPAQAGYGFQDYHMEAFKVLDPCKLISRNF